MLRQKLSDGGDARGREEEGEGLGEDDNTTQRGLEEVLKASR